MQIHELNNKKQQVNEVDLFGPNSVFNVGKQVLKNPKAFVNSSALGAAQQAAAQSSAASSADTLAKQGYTASGSAKAQTTPQQQLAQVQSNPAVQRMVKNLAAQWKTQGVAAAGKIKTTKVAESLDIDPSTLKDPKDRALLNKWYTQQGLEMPQAASTPPEPNVAAAANQKLNAFSTEFQNWAEPKLRAIGVNLATVMQDPWAAKTIQEILTKLSVESLANPESPETTGLVEQFFNVVIATNQAAQQGQQAARGPAPGAGANAAAGAEQPDDATILKQYGLTMSPSQLDTLGTAMRRSANGETTIRNTGNELLNAVARLAGFKVAAT